ncbi:O-Antigen ligase [compost metagenome]
MQTSTIRRQRIIAPAKKLLSLCVIFLIYISSGSLDLLKEGGARPQSAEFVNSYSGPLNYILPAWTMIAILTVAVISLTRPKVLIKNADKNILFILALIAISIAWANDAYIATRTLIFLTVTYLIVLTYISLNDINTIISLISKTIITMLVMSLIFSIALPTYGISVGGESAGAWQGIFNHKNNLGNFSAFSFCILVGALQLKKNPEIYIGIILSAFLTWMSNSFTSIAATLLGAIIYIFLKEKNCLHSTYKLRKFYFFAAMGLSALTVYISIFNQGTAIFNKDTSFSDRNLIWAFVLNKIYENPLGYGISQFGIYSGGQDTSFLNSIGFVVGHPHNGFIEILYSLGLLGFLISTKLLFNIIKYSSTKTNFKLNLITVSSIIIINTFESRFISFSFGFFVLCVIICLNKKLSPAHTKWHTSNKLFHAQPTDTQLKITENL